MISGVDNPVDKIVDKSVDNSESGPHAVAPSSSLQQSPAVFGRFGAVGRLGASAAPPRKASPEISPPIDERLDTLMVLIDRLAREICYLHDESTAMRAILTEWHLNPPPRETGDE